MYRKEVNEHSPLRILDRSIHGGLGPGNLGVVMSRAGSGKTALLVQIGLDDLLRDRRVLHVSLGHSLDHVHAWYDALFEDLATITKLEDRGTVYASIARNRVIQTYPDHDLTPDRLDKAVNRYAQHIGFHPSAILIDGYDWEGPVARRAAEIGAFKSLARRLNAELWMTAQTHRSTTGSHPTTLVRPCEAFADVIDVAIFLEPHGTHETVRLLKDHGDASLPDVHLLLDCNALRIIEEGSTRPAPVRIPHSSYTLLSGGASGAEEEFGSCAERWGIQENNFSFSGRPVVRTRGLVELNEFELRQGDVSEAYLKAQLHRRFPASPGFQRVLQTIWHQVATSGQVFVVGTILPDGTVKGGTGWAAELARHFGKDLHVFDQERKSWVRWTGTQWEQEEAPRVARMRFTGTGTRTLSDAGREAITDLFVRSFGPPPA